MRNYSWLSFIQLTTWTRWATIRPYNSLWCSRCRYTVNTNTPRNIEETIHWSYDCKRKCLLININIWHGSLGTLPFHKSIPPFEGLDYHETLSLVCIICEIGSKWSILDKVWSTLPAITPLWLFTPQPRRELLWLQCRQTGSNLI